MTIKDSTWDGAIPGGGAAEFHTLTTESRVLSKAQWDLKWTNLADPMVCTTASTFGAWKGNIEILCSEIGCTYAQVQMINSNLAKVGVPPLNYVPGPYDGPQ